MMIDLRHTLPFFIIFLLSGCSYLKTSTTSTDNIKSIHWQKFQSTCSNEILENGTCPSITFDSLKFNKNKHVNALIDQKLLKMVNAAKNTTVEDYLTNSLARANNGYNLTISVQLMSENDVLIVLSITMQETHAIDQYSPKKISFINYDKNKQTNISLEDSILPDKTKAFWSNAELAYHQWLEVQQLLNNDIYQESWPFTKTQNIALLPKQVVLKYNGNTLAPYAMGEPTLFIPYDQLKDILKPEYLPR